VCKSCSGAVKFGRTAGPGVRFKLIVDCSCEKRQILSSPISQNVYEINRRLLFAFRVFGCGLQTVKTFCSLLDIKHSFSNSQYYNFLDNLHAASKVSCLKKMRRQSVCRFGIPYPPMPQTELLKPLPEETQNFSLHHEKLKKIRSCLLRDQSEDLISHLTFF